MSTRSARVSLRYRPGADVLSGHIDLGELGAGETVTESPDADSTIVWASTSHGPQGPQQLLASFQFVYAAARLHQGNLPLPEGLTPTVRSLVDTALTSISGVDNPLTKLKARAEAHTELPLDALRRSERPERPPGPERLDQHVDAVANSLSRLADAVHKRVPVEDELEASHTDHLSRLLRELSSTISYGKGRTAPGTTAATRAALRGRLPLTAREQQTLEQALGDLDDPVSWHTASHSLDQLSSTLESAVLLE